jgi:aminoglycoside/choline kinase family phosphotransferase
MLKEDCFPSITITERNEKKRTFLKNSGWADAVCTLMGADASKRHYERLHHTTQGIAVLMDAPPEFNQKTEEFIAITHFLSSNGFSVPEILCFDLDHGFVLMEDLGFDTINTVLCQRPAHPDILKSAMEVLARFLTIQTPQKLSLPLLNTPEKYVDISYYDTPLLLKETDLFMKYWIGGVMGESVSPDMKEEFNTLISDMVSLLPHNDNVFILRDYHVDNLMWLPNRDGIKRIGLLDYQDSVRGSSSYDVVSLLQDARHTFSPDIEQSMLHYYIQQAQLTGCIDNSFDEIFRQSYVIMGLQRNLKIIGIFSRLWLQDGNSTYMQHIPRLWRYILERNFSTSIPEIQQEIQKLAEFIYRYVPEPNNFNLQKLPESQGIKP